MTVTSSTGQRLGCACEGLLNEHVINKHVASRARAVWKCQGFLPFFSFYLLRVFVSGNYSYRFRFEDVMPKPFAPLRSWISMFCQKNETEPESSWVFAPPSFLLQFITYFFMQRYGLKLFIFNLRCSNSCYHIWLLPLTLPTPILCMLCFCSNPVVP